MPAPEAAPRWVRRIPQAAAATTLIVSSAFLVTWNLGSAGIGGWVPEPSSTRPLSAVLFILLGAAVLASPPAAVRPSSALRRSTTFGLAVAVVLLGLLTLLEYALGVSLGIDRLLLVGSQAWLPEAEMVRTSLPAAVAFVVLGTALALLDRPVRGRWTAAPLALLVLVLAAVALTAYEYAGSQPFGPTSMLSMSWVTALLLMGLSAAVLFLRPERLPVRALFTDSPGASMIRAVVPSILIVLMALGWLGVAGRSAGLFGPEFGVAFLVVSAIVVLTMVVWTSASRVDRLDVKRREAAVAAARQEDAAREAEARYRELFNEVPVGLVCTTPDGRILDANPFLVKLLGFPDRGALLEENVRDLYVTPADRGVLLSPLDRGQAASTLEFQLRRSDASVIWARSRVHAVHDASGRVLRYEASLVDISDEREGRRRGLDAERSATVSQLAGFLAHDLNTPLTNIALIASSIGRATKDPDILAKVEKLHAQRRMAAELIRDLMGIAKLRDVDAVGVEVDLRKVVRAAVDAVEVYRKAGVEVRLRLPEAPIVVVGDALQLQEAVANLVKNAYQATAAGFVTVELGERGDRAAISVADTGHGITAEVRPHLFEPFFTTKPRGEGTGLGLPLCRDVVRAHGGSIEVASEPGRGTTFVILLPRDRDVPPAVEAAAPPADRPGKP